MHDVIVEGAAAPDTGDVEEPNADVSSDAQGTRRPPLRRWLSGRWAPVAASVVTVAVGMWYMLYFNQVFLGQAYWASGGDLWGIVQAAHSVQWGYFGGIYDPVHQVVTFPGIFILLVPAAWLVSTLHLAESSPPFFINHPPSLLVYQPVELLLGIPILFAVNSLCHTLGVPARRRIATVWVVGVLALPVSAAWSHTEDLLAVALLLFATRAALERRWGAAGWLLGAGIVIQPLVGLAAPVLVASLPARERIGAIVKGVLPSVVLVGLAFVGNPSGTYRSVVEQPTPPAVNHATPWVSLAPSVPPPKPVLPPGMVAPRAVAPPSTVSHPHFKVVETALHPPVMKSVSGGPVRTFGVLLAVALGLLVWRRRVTPSGLLWLLAVALAIRGYFEPVMTPYYLVPPLALGFMAAARAGRARLASAAAVGFAMTVFGYYHLSPWAWWGPMMVGMTVVLVLGFPGSVAIDLHRRRLVTAAVDDATWFTEDVAPAGEVGHGTEGAVDSSERPDGVLTAGEPLAP